MKKSIYWFPWEYWPYPISSQCCISYRNQPGKSNHWFLYEMQHWVKCAIIYQTELWSKSTIQYSKKIKCCSKLVTSIINNFYNFEQDFIVFLISRQWLNTYQKSKLKTLKQKIMKSHISNSCFCKIFLTLHYFSRCEKWDN